MKMTDYMDEAMREAKEEHLRQHTLDKYYRKMHFANLVRRAEFMEERGIHLKEHITQESLKVSLAEIAHGMTLTTESRHRMAKEIAEELIAEKGEAAHFYCVEKLANDTTAPKLWRDVLTYIDEMEVNDGGGDKRGDFPEHRTQLQDSAEDDS
jgi:hypothetical protein